MDMMILMKVMVMEMMMILIAALIVMEGMRVYMSLLVAMSEDQQSDLSALQEQPGLVAKLIGNRNKSILN
jgi:sensor domain CHASE-containing protein